MLDFTIKIFAVGNMIFTPFHIKEFEKNPLLERCIVFTDWPDDWDIFAFKKLNLIQSFIKKYGDTKKYLLCTNEPRHNISFEKKIIYNGVEIHIVNAYTGDYSTNNYFEFKFNRWWNITDPLNDQSGFTRTKGKRIAALLSYRTNKKRWGLIRNGVDIDLSIMRTQLALRGHQLGKLDVYGKGWPKDIALEDSRLAIDWKDRKQAILKDYSFNIALENTNIDYYCTEKIWDSIRAGCLPIYYGKGNKIYETFPRNSFLDYAEFENPEALFDYIDQMGFAEFKERYNLCLNICLELLKKYSTEEAVAILREQRIDNIVNKFYYLMGGQLSNGNEEKSLIQTHKRNFNLIRGSIINIISGAVQSIIPIYSFDKDLMKGDELLKNKQFAEAETVFYKMTQRYPKNKMGYVKMAMVAIGQEQWEIAQKRWEKVLELFPDDMRAMIRLGNVLYEQNKYTEGHTIFKKIRGKFPDRPAPIPHFKSMGAGFYSQNGQDRYIVEIIFNRKRNGFFVDVGAHGGIELSNSYFLEKDCGWGGIAIEPNPKIFDQLKRNRNCKTLQICISDFNGEADFLAIEGRGNKLSGILDKYDKRHLERIEKATEHHTSKKKIIKVQCMTLNKLFETHLNSKIDFLSIDTEGGELGILKSIDFNKWEIEVICVENNFGSNGIRDLLQGKGYKLMAIGGADEIYKKRTDG